MPVAIVYMIAETAKTAVTLVKQYQEYKARKEGVVEK